MLRAPWKVSRTIRIAAAAVSGTVFGAPSSNALQWESIGPNGGRVDGLAQSAPNPEQDVRAFLSPRSLALGEPRSQLGAGGRGAC